MRSVLAAAVVLSGCLVFCGPSAAAVSIKDGSPPDRLGGCAIAINRWNATLEAQGGAKQPEYAQRLETIMALSRTQTGEWSKAFTASLHAQIARYDGMTPEAELRAMQKDMFECETFFDADTRPAEPTYAGPFLAGPGWKISLATPPSYAGYCYLAFASLMNFQSAKGISDPQVIGARNGFNEIIGGMGEGYRNVAIESANNRNTFYTNTRNASGDPEFLKILEKDVADCAQWIVQR